MRIALLHRYPAEQIKETNAAFPYLQAMGIDVLTFKKFDRLTTWKKAVKDILWMFYAPILVWGKKYDVIYCDDSIPFYPALVKLASPKSKVIIRLGDLHLMYYFSGWAYDFLHFFEVLAWHCADRIICISKVMSEKVHDDIYYLGKYVGNSWDDPIIHTVLDPVDPKDFPLSQGDRTIPNTVMFHGTLTKNKNVDILIDAAYRLPNVNFVIIGDGPDRERLEDYAPYNVFFKGWVPFKSMVRHIETCAMGVALRSDNPGNEFVVTSPFVQYGICGKPCLVTRREVFEDYKWQFSGVDEMVEKIEDILTSKHDPDAIRNYFIKNHGAEKIAEEIWQILV